MAKTVSFSSQTYDLVSVKKAAYRFLDVMAIDVTSRGDEIECVLNFLAEAKDQDGLVNAFKNEVLDQDLRAIVAKETEVVRNAVLAFAFSKTGLQDVE